MSQTPGEKIPEEFVKVIVNYHLRTKDVAIF